LYENIWRSGMMEKDFYRKYGMAEEKNIRKMGMMKRKRI